jgi:acetyl-CoA C-acetyltransferase
MTEGLMQKVYIVAAKRTAIGTFGGSLRDIPAPRLAARVIEAALAQSGLEPRAVDETIVGNVLSAGLGMGPGRQAALYAGLPKERPAYAVNFLCGSGMKAAMIGATDIRLGEASVVVAAGMENMSRAPYLLGAEVRYGTRFGDRELRDSMLADGLIDVFHDVHMGVTAENVARKHRISREEQDRFALESQRRAAEAAAAGRFAEEIVPVEVSGKKETMSFDRDEHLRADASVEGLQRLKPAFEAEGTVTAGNSSGINDGASALVLASGSTVRERGLTPLAEILGAAQIGNDPAYMGLAPVPAVKKLLGGLGLDLKDIDLIELNEAFAAQSLGVVIELGEHYGLDRRWFAERTNVNGGAIALGHPIGASGNRIMVTLLYEMRRRGLSLGLATLCCGGGMGTAVLLGPAGGV